MLQGSQVIVKNHENKPEKKRIWEDEGTLRVFVITEEGWQRREAPLFLPELVVVLKERVFKWNESLFEEMVKLEDKPSELESLWQKAELWEDLEPLKRKFEV
ncbi:hypothetical protein ACFLYG_00395 [Chloroflexota bacterium]